MHFSEKLHAVSGLKKITVFDFLFADKMKDAIIAKVAAQAADFYKEANSAFQVSSVKQQLEKVSNGPENRHSET